MESLSIIWEPAAIMAVMDTLEWYKNNGYGEQFARTFINNINDALSSIATSPGIGKFYKIINAVEYRIMPTHPKSSLLYYVKGKELHVIDIIYSKMNNNN